MINLPTLQTILRHFGPRLKEHQGKLAKREDLPAYVDRRAERHPATEF
jgi:hypothetical protein